eukprot:14527121-Heterocapsa_arctica.AAC.1
MSWKIFIGQRRAEQQGALKVCSNDGVNTCRAMRRTTTAWSGSSAMTTSCSSRRAGNSRTKSDYDDFDLNGSGNPKSNNGL